MLRAVSLVLWLAYLVCCEGMNILILGDSVDRHIVEDWCAGTNSSGFNTHVVGWGPKSLKYGGITSIISPSYCVNGDGDSIAQIHLFGSNAHGPYYSDKWEMDNSKFEVRDSSFRCTEGIRIYVEFYGVPDRIFLKTVNWDNALAQNNRDNSEVSHFIQNTHDRIREIESVVGKDVQIGVMTAPQVWYGGSAVPHLNVLLREFASAHNLMLYDYDYDVWGSKGFQFNKETQLAIMRSEFDIHPNIFYSAQAGRKILGHLYSGYFQPQGRNNSAHSYYTRIPKLLSDYVFVHEISAIENNEGEAAPTVTWHESRVSYLQLQAGGWKRWEGVLPAHLRLMHQGPHDIMPLSVATINSTELVATFPSALFVATSGKTSQGRVGFMTDGGKCGVVLGATRVMMLKDEERYSYLQIPREVIVVKLIALV